jgi:hypothetical protein
VGCEQDTDLLCGETVHPGEVEWISDTDAEVDFFGSVIEEGS